ncbi:MAG: N-acetyltransferase [Croceitalea sp.]|nr:N-acetyltransferase [Croceitalea sp.]NNM18860.1 N-acetyltransferase [Croceitalea sp.]
MDHKVTDNSAKKQYELLVDDKLARLEYIVAQNRIFLTHTEVPIGLEGRGIGSELIRQVLEDIQLKNMILVPLCPFVAGYIKKHPEWKSLVLKGINIA